MFVRVRESLKSNFEVYIIDSVITTSNLIMILEDHGMPMYIVDSLSKIRKITNPLGYTQLLL